METSSAVRLMNLKHLTSVLIAVLLGGAVAHAEHAPGAVSPTSRQSTVIRAQGFPTPRFVHPGIPLIRTVPSAQSGDLMSAVMGIL